MIAWASAGGQNGHFSPAWKLGLRTKIFSARVTNA